MFLPGGDRAGGLKEMEQTRSKGMLLRGEADYQLHLIYLWYERQPMTALRLIEGLRTRYPHNPVFYLRLAEVQGNYIRNHQAALQTYRSMLDAARAGRIAAPALSEVDARLGMAQEMDALCDSAGAIEQLNAVDRAASRRRRTPRSRARTINSASFTIARDVEPMRSRRISARAPRTLATIDCACARRFAQAIARAPATARVPLVQIFFVFNHFFVDFESFLIHNLHLV